MEPADPAHGALAHEKDRRNREKNVKTRPARARGIPSSEQQEVSALQLPEIYEDSASRWLRAGLLIFAGIGVCLLWGGVLLELAGIIFGGAVLSFLLSPLAQFLERRLPRPLAAGLALIGAIGALITLATLALPALSRQLSTMLDMLPNAVERLRTLSEALLEQLRRRAPELRLPDFNFSGMESALSEAMRRFAVWLGGVTGRLYRFALMAALSCFFLSDRDRILLRLELVVPAKWRSMAVRGGNMLLRELRLYLRGQATIALAVGALAALGLILTGIPGAPLLGALVGILNVIPYLGPFLGGIPAVASALSIGWQKALLTFAVLTAVQQIDGMVISPRVMGSVTGFSPAIVLLALFAGANLGGVSGMLFSLPVLMAVRSFYRVYVQRNERSAPQNFVNYS